MGLFLNNPHVTSKICDSCGTVPVNINVTACPKCGAGNFTYQNIEPAEQSHNRENDISRIGLTQNSSSVKEAAVKTKNILLAIAISILLLIVAINVITYILHSGSCVGPEGDYSNCYP